MKIPSPVWLLFLALPFSLKAQFNAPALIFLPEKADGADRRLQTLIDGDYISGTPYMFNNWKKGIVLLKNGNSFPDVYLKYDAYHQVLLFLRGKDTLEVTDPVKEFTLDKDSATQYHFINADEYGKVKQPMFYELLLEEKKGHLLKAHRLVVKTSDRILNARIERYLDFNYEYFYYNAVSGKISRLALSPFKIMDALKLTPEEQSRLHFSSYSFSEESDLIKFFTAYLGS